MMAPDYAHWHGMYEVAERFYMQLIPQAREIVEHARGQAGVEDVERFIAELLARPEHAWYRAELAQKKVAEPDAEPAKAAD